MTRLPPPEQWVLCKMNEMEVAEMIEQHIDFYTVDKDGNRRSVHLPTPFVRHFMRRRRWRAADQWLPSRRCRSSWRTAICWRRTVSTACAASSFIIQDELRAVIPQREDCTPERVKAAMEFLCDEWLVDVATDYTGKAHLIAAALTLIERSLLPDRPCFFVTAGRRGGGKTTTIIMLIMAVTGDHAGGGGVVDQRGGAAQGADEPLPLRRALHPVGQHRARHADLVPAHREVLHRGVLFRPQARRQRDGLHRASTIHLFTGNNIGAKGDLASRSLHIRLDVDRVDPENRPFKHPNPIGWTENHRAEILAALYTILLGNPQLKTPRDAEGKTRFKMWWRLVGSAVEHAARAGRAGARLPEVVHHAGGGRRGIGIARRRARGPGEEMAEPVHGERRGGDDQQPEPERRRTDAARISAAGRPAQPRVLGKIHRQAAEKTPRRAGSQRQPHTCAAKTDKPCGRVRL